MLSAKPWRGEAVILFWCLLFLCWFFGAIAVVGLQKAGVTGFNQMNGPGAVLLDTLSLHGTAWVLILIFLRQHQVRWGEALGWRGTQPRRALLLALLVAVVVLPLVEILHDVCVSVLTQLRWAPEDEAAVKMIAGASVLWLQVYLGLFTVLLAPVAEEFAFRGMLYPFFKQLGWPRLAWLGVNLLFALVHANVAAFLPLFVLGLVLTWLYEKTDNLLAPIAVHALFNAANFVVLQFREQLEQLFHKFYHVLHLI
jgi:hypothetical protein